MSVCRSCGAEIRWVEMEGSGKRMPIDPAPSPRGNVEVFDNVNARVVAGPDLLVGVNYYTSHFATCPQAAKHRKGPR